jgi:hypothetical protein
MSRTRIAFPSSFILGLSLVAGCASGPPLSAVVPTTHLVPEIAATDAAQPVTMRAAPVQLGSEYGVGRDAAHRLLPVAMQLELVPTGPFRALPWWSDTQPFLHSADYERSGASASLAERNSDELVPVADESGPRVFAARTVPLLPYGAFWVEVTNHSDHAITVGPKQLRLRDGSQTRSPLADRGSIQGRYDLVLRGVAVHGFGDMVASDDQARARDALPMFDHPVTIQPGAVFSGYVVFDTKSYTADEYNAFLAHAGQLTLELTDAATTLASVAFQGQSKSLPALCLPGTAHPSFARCEVVQQ